MAVKGKKGILIYLTPRAIERANNERTTSLGNRIPLSVYLEELILGNRLDQHTHKNFNLTNRKAMFIIKEIADGKTASFNVINNTEIEVICKRLGKGFGDNRTQEGLVKEMEAIRFLVNKRVTASSFSKKKSKKIVIYEIDWNAVPENYRPIQGESSDSAQACKVSSKIDPFKGIIDYLDEKNILATTTGLENSGRLEIYLREYSDGSARIPERERQEVLRYLEREGLAVEKEKGDTTLFVQKEVVRNES
ncbi:MAG: hypothetical protein M0Z77_04210 [Thermoplasmatales archaeon]|jgi:hypothetical protein|nr:hypothetical protein [Candidatus Thermoplasmatota archaeon]MDA8054839.1 hypothetical protein [Thermoplasmatales archaeon]